MQGKKEFEGSLFCDIDLMEVIGQDHLLVRLNDALDLRWIREATKDYYSHTGRPSVDPVALVKMMLIGYLYGIPSERRLAEEVRLNIAYRWFAGYNLDEETPDHSVFSKARARFGRDLFLLVFKDVLSRCIAAGLLRGDAILVDCTLIDADASMKSLVEVELSPDGPSERLGERDVELLRVLSRDPGASWTRRRKRSQTGGGSRVEAGGSSANTSKARRQTPRRWASARQRRVHPT